MFIVVFVLLFLLIVGFFNWILLRSPQVCLLLTGAQMGSLGFDRALNFVSFSVHAVFLFLNLLLLLEGLLQLIFNGDCNFFLSLASGGDHSAARANTFVRTGPVVAIFNLDADQVCERGVLHCVLHVLKMKTKGLQSR